MYVIHVHTKVCAMYSLQADAMQTLHCIALYCIALCRTFIFLECAARKVCSAAVTSRCVHGAVLQ